MAEKLRPMSRVRSRSAKLDSVKRSKTNIRRRNFDLLWEAQMHWNNMDRFRRERQRNKRYTYGDQWKDIITVDGETMTEEQYIMSQGNVPLKNNLIRRLVTTTVGIYRQQSKEPICTARDRDEQQLSETMSTILQCNMQRNNMTEVYARTVEDYLIGGLVAHRKWHGWQNGDLDCWTNYVQPDNLIIDSNMRDMRGWDCRLIGEIHDIDIDEVCQRFARTPDEVEHIHQMYHFSHDRSSYVTYMEQFGYSFEKNMDFFVCNDSNLCRVIEVWRKETKPRYRCHDYNTGEVYKIDIEDYASMVEAVNRDRMRRGAEMGMSADDIPLIEAEWFLDNYWYYYFLTPFGDILEEGETPYSHKSHPYVFKAYPFIDGEIHSFVSDVIDTQRYTNRLITLYDWIMRASAKGVLLFPEECLPKGMDINDIADEWSRFNGVIAIKTKNATTLPKQVANNSTNIGISELLNLQLKFFEEISGVSGALQGKQGWSGMSASLYAQQTQNGTTALADVLESFSQFVIDAAKKDVKNMQQYYDDNRVFSIAGKKAAKIKDVRNIDFDFSIVESTSTPAFRAMANDFLMEIWRSNQISLQMLLENGDFPFADQLLQSLQSQQEQMAQGGTPQGLSPELMQQAQQGADMNAVNRAYGMLRGRAAA